MIADRLRSIQAVSGGGGGATDVFYAYRSLILNMQGTAGTATFTDDSPNPVSITSYGGAQLVSDPTFGTVGSFPTANDYLNSTSGVFSFGSGDFTVEYWFKKTEAFSGTYEQIAGDASTSTSLGFGIFNNKIYATTINAGYQSTTVLSLNQWYHFAAVRESGVLKLYLNGNLDATHNLTTNLSNTQFWVSKFSTTQFPYNGQIGPLRISPWAVYTSNFTPSQDLFPAIQGTPPQDPRNSLILNMQGTSGGTTFIDESPNAFTVTRNGNTVLVSDATFGTVASFDGTGDSLSVASNAAFAFGTGDFTVEFWCYIVGSGVISLYDCRVNETSPNGNGFVIGIDPSLKWAVYQAGYKIIGPTRTLNQWTHIAVTRVGTSVKMFIDGSQAGSTWVTSNSFSDAAFLVGTDYPRNARFLNGLIGPLRITKGVARYTSNFTPPTGLFPTS